MSDRYSYAIRLVHWLTAFLILTQVTLAVMNILVHETNPGLAEWFIQAHLSLGAIIFAVTFLRIFLRVKSRKQSGFSVSLIGLSRHLVHSLIYMCLISLPLSGYVRLAAIGFEIKLFNLVPLPALQMNVELAILATQWHKSITFILAVLLALHIGAAVFHKRIDGTVVTNNMRL